MKGADSMKKIIAIISAMALCLVLGACSSNALDGDGMENPVASCTLEDVANELGLKPIKTDGIALDSVSKIEGDLVIYSFDVNVNDNIYNVRIARADDNESADISGVYLDGKINSAIYDSADELAPSVNVECSSNASKAYCSWRGYLFSISCDKKISLDDMQMLTVKLAKEIITVK